MNLIASTLFIVFSFTLQAYPETGDSIVIEGVGYKVTQDRKKSSDFQEVVLTLESIDPPKKTLIAKFYQNNKKNTEKFNRSKDHSVKINKNLENGGLHETHYIPSYTHNNIKYLVEWSPAKTTLLNFLEDLKVDQSKESRSDTTVTKEGLDSKVDITSKNIASQPSTETFDTNIGLAMKIGVEIHSTLEKIWGLGFVYGDIKKGNIILDNDFKAHLIDFETIQKENETKSLFSKNYTPPEAYLKNYKLNRSLDAFALGVLLFEIATNDIELKSNLTREENADLFTDTEKFDPDKTGISIDQEVAKNFKRNIDALQTLLNSHPELKTKYGDDFITLLRSLTNFEPALRTFKLTAAMALHARIYSNLRLHIDTCSKLNGKL